MTRRAPRRGRVLFAMLLAALLSSQNANGRSREGKSDPAAVEQANRLLGEARTALAAKDTATAQRLASQAYRGSPTPEGLFLLGQVALAENRLLDAQDFMRRYLADPNLEAAADSEEPKQAQLVLERARPKSAQLNILGDRSTVVSLDDRIVGVLPLVRPLLVSPGEHKVVLERRSSRLEDQVRVPLGRLGEVRCNFATKALVLTVLPGVLLVDESTLAGTEQSQLGQLVEEQVVARRLSPIGPRDAAECGEPAPGSCSEPLRCQVSTAQRCEADYVLRTRVRREGAPPPNLGTLRLEVELIDVAVGDVAAREQRDCPNCASAAGLEKLKEQVESVLTKGLSRAHGQLEVSSEPSGATVLFDGRAVGATPYKAEVFVGGHQIEIKKDGFQKFEQLVDVSDGQAANVAANLIAVAVTPEVPKETPRQTGRPLWRLLGGGIAIGAGVVLAGFGVSALAVNGHCLDMPLTRVDPSCDTVYKTTTTGGALMGIGSALIVGGAVLIAVPPKARRAQ